MRDNCCFVGEDVTGWKGENLRRHRRHIQMVFQDPAAAFFPRMRVWDAVTEPLRNYSSCSRGELRGKSQAVTGNGGAPTGVSGPVSSLHERRPAPAAGHCPGPGAGARGALCDEATSALDVSTQDQLVELLVELQRQRELAILFVCHDLALVSPFPTGSW